MKNKSLSFILILLFTSTTFIVHSQEQDFNYYYEQMKSNDGKNPILVIANSMKVLQIDPKTTTAWFYNGKANNDLYMYWNTIAAYDKYIQINPNWTGAYTNRGNAYAMIGYDDLSIADYNKCLEMESDSWYGHINKANAYLRINNIPLFLENTYAAIEVNPNHPLNYTLLGQYYWGGKQDFDSACYYFNKAVEIENTNAYAYYHRGLMKKQLDYSQSEVESDFNKAIELFSEKINQNPEDYPALTGRAETYQELGKKEKSQNDYLKALPILNKLIASYPKSYRLVYSRGCIYDSLNEKDKSTVDFNKALEINPNFPFVKWTLDFEKIKKSNEK